MRVEKLNQGEKKFQTEPQGEKKFQSVQRRKFSKKVFLKQGKDEIVEWDVEIFSGGKRFQLKPRG